MNILTSEMIISEVLAALDAHVPVDVSETAHRIRMMRSDEQVTETELREHIIETALSRGAAVALDMDVAA